MINEMKERFISFHKRRAPKGIAVDGSRNFIQLGFSNPASQLVMPTEQIKLFLSDGVLEIKDIKSPDPAFRVWNPSGVLCTLCSLTTSSLSRLSCGHEFCKLCLTRRILHASLCGDDGSFLVCPDKNCNHEFIEEEVKDFCVNMPSLIDRFQLLTAKKECTICLKEKRVSAIITIHGDHQFCKNCLVEQLDCAWKDQTDPFFLCCPEQGCRYELQESDVRKFSDNDRHALENFCKIKLRKLVFENPNMHLCPGVDCDFIYEIPEGRLPEQIICPRSFCGKVFCSACRESHNPTAINCAELARMKNMSKIEEERATIEWIDKNTKPCPSCKKPAEKNGGCQYVKCKCQELFCWICGESFGKKLTGHPDSLPAHGWHESD